MGGEEKMNDLEIGDTICCHDLADMKDVANELRQQGYLITMQSGFTIRIESVPDRDTIEQDGWVTWREL